MVRVGFAEATQCQAAVDSARIVRGDRSLSLSGLTEALLSALQALQSEVATTELEERILETEGVAGLAHWLSVLGQLEGIAALRYTLTWDGLPLAYLTPARRSDGIDDTPPVGLVTLSRFAYLRRHHRRLMLDSPLGVGPVEVGLATTLVGLQALSEVVDCGGRLAEAEDVAVAGLTGGWFAHWCGFLRSAGLVVSVDSTGTSSEDRQPALQCWEFADLLMHSRSRSTRADQPIGGTFPGRGVTEPLPALRPLASSEIIALPVPDLVALARSDESLLSVMEARRSIRRHGQIPMDVAQLSEFLYRAARIVADREIPAGDGSFEITRRVAPSGGSCHPLEVYVVVGNCRGLAPGVYHYHPAEHCLGRLGAAERDLGLVLDSRYCVMEDGGRPQILLCLTARFRRTSWKYQGVAYANVLKEVGVLYEAMYLIATAMGLAPCALGGGDTAAIVAMLGLDPLEEGPVGEFLLGSVAR